MGYIIGNNAIKPLESRAEGIVNCPMPTTKKQLLRFIGLIGHDRNFIESFYLIELGHYTKQYQRKEEILNGIQKV